MAEIGKIGGPKGYAATVARHWGGDKEASLAHQRRGANQAVIEVLVEIDQRTKFQAGADVICTEQPIVLEPDEDSTSRDMKSQSRQGPASRSG